MLVLKQRDLGHLLVILGGYSWGEAWGGAIEMGHRTLGKHLLFAVWSLMVSNITLLMWSRQREPHHCSNKAHLQAPTIIVKSHPTPTVKPCPTSWDSPEK